MPGIKQHSHRNALGSTFSGLQRNVIRIKCELDYVSVLCPLRVLKIQNNLIYYEPESALNAELGEIRHSWFHALPMQWARLCSHTGIMIQISSIDRMSIVPAVWKEFLLKHFFEWCGSYPSELKRLQLNSIWKISESFKRLCYGNESKNEATVNYRMFLLSLSCGVLSSSNRLSFLFHIRYAHQFDTILCLASTNHGWEVAVYVARKNMINVSLICCLLWRMIKYTQTHAMERSENWNLCRPCLTPAKWFSCGAFYPL